MAGTSAGAKKGWAGRTRKGGGGPKELKKAPKAVNYKLNVRSAQTALSDLYRSYRKKMSAASSDTIKIKAAKDAAKIHKVRYQDLLTAHRPDNNIRGSKSWNKFGDIV